MSYTTPYFPRPKDQSSAAMYQWAKKVTRWFENWVSSKTGVGTDSTYQIPSYTMALRWSNDIWLGGTLYGMVYRDSTPYNSRSYDLHWSVPLTVGTIGTARYRSNTRCVVVPANTGASGLVTLLKSGVWTDTVKVYGPYGLVDSVAISKT